MRFVPNLAAFANSESAGESESWFDQEEPLRAELFSAEQMAQHGVALAQRHRTGVAGRSRHALLARLSNNERLLTAAVRLLADAIKVDRAVTPASEWLLDNFYLIDENIRTARRHFPKAYSRELPRLASGASAGMPRVYDIALEAIAHGDGRISPDSLTRFIAAYQTITVLSLGELWALPIMLRLALIENLRRVAARIAAGRIHRNLATSWSDRMIKVATDDPKNLILVVADMARSQPPSTSAFVAELSRRLQGHGHSLTLPLTWMDQHLAESGLGIDQLVQAENQQQAADQVSISNSIASLRILASTDWSDFVEALSSTEKTLRGDPAGVYATMDFATRDSYRHVIEILARRSGSSEDGVARRAIAFAHFAAIDFDTQDCRTHVGYYLVDAGLPQLEGALGIHSWLGERALSHGERAVRFFSSIALLTGAFAGIVGWIGNSQHVYGGRLALLVALALVAGSELAIVIVNRVTTMLLKPVFLPRLDFSRGIPAAFRTLVAVPSLLRDEETTERLVQALEVRYLANRDAELRFALLTDFGDADAQTLAQDEPLLQHATSAIARLNAKYRHGSTDIFFLLHRPRRWTAGEGAWIGHERKRGKLGDLNALLLDGRRENFSRIEGDLDALAGVRYVITLDSDTQLPRDAARRLVATLAHPLNRAAREAGTRRIEAGYGILQPRVATSLPSAQSTRYARMHGGDAGIDPYTRSVSDVYQDAFGEGSFTGKGIYDVAAFEAVMRGAFPENSILSHDLLEGCYARSALISDVELYEDYPAHYLSDAARHERWIRGDWQIAGWLRTSVRDEAGKRARNPLSGLSQWKVFDNLRRSLVPIALTALLLFGWLTLPSAWIWSLLAACVLLLPDCCAALVNMARKPRDLGWAQHLRVAIGNAGLRLGNTLFRVVCLPYEAWMTAVAILRTLARMLITRRHLLQWTPFSELERRLGNSFATILRALWPAPVVAIVVAVWLLARDPASFAAALPYLACWLLAPVAVWWLGQPIDHEGDEALSAGDAVFLRRAARRTWAYFERFVGAEDHWLPPDNVQETPAQTIAHRTSPTNIGLALLANLSACDFGYIGVGTLLTRTDNTLRALQSLATERGHFYNWYDTRTLRPLLPLYLSTVDNGNLAVHLLVLHAGLLEVGEQPIVGARAVSGVRDCWEILRDVSPSLPPVLIERFERALREAEQAQPTLLALWITLRTLREIALELPRAHGADDEPTRWTIAVEKQCEDLLADLALLAGWLPSAAAAPLQLRELLESFPIPALGNIESAAAGWLAQLRASAKADDSAWIESFQHEIERSAQHARTRREAIVAIAAMAERLAQMDFSILYDADRHLFSIGYNATERRLDSSFYDLLASEARLASYFAIAFGQVSQENWYALGRLLAQTSSGPVLVSWSGSMFEYLMPVLVAPSYRGSLLDESCRGCVQQQIAYGRESGIPWGISESGYNLFDAALNYQYRAFGVPGLGLKRGLAEDIVVAPYATALALTMAPRQAARNLARLAADGMLGSCGFYEARDYTLVRMRRGETSAIVQSFMAHHQGMSLLAFAHVLFDAPTQRRFCAVPQFRAALNLLQERIPRVGVIARGRTEMVDVRAPGEAVETPIRVYETGATPTPAVQLLSNGRYHLMLTNAGGGYSRWRDLAVTRWREDTTCDPWGLFCFVRDVGLDRNWSATWQPVLSTPDFYEAIFTESRVEFRRQDGDIGTHTDIAVSPEDDIELRRIRLINRARTRKTIEFTSCGEVVIAPPPADAAQRGFGNLFVQTSIVAERDAIVCTRRPRSKSERPPWMLHLVKVRGGSGTMTTFETDRARFLGRGNNLARASAIAADGPLSGASGAVLDPLVAIRHRVVLEPEQTLTIDVVTGVTEDRETCYALIDKYQDRTLADRVFDLAWTHSQVALRQINVTEADAQLYGRIAGRIIYANASLRADAALIASNRRNQTGLWGYAISGDLPILLLKVRDSNSIALARQLVQAHAYWRMKGVMVDLVIWNDDRGGYRQLLQEQIMGLIAAHIEGNIIDRPGGIFVRPVDQVSPDDRILLQAAARVVIADDRGALIDQVRRRDSREASVPAFTGARGEAPGVETAAEITRPLLMLNGSGGFSADGSEYVITTNAKQRTPLPWVNIIANPDFGTVVSESGAGYTWAENAHEFRLTPWHDDPVSDPAGEAFYLRDEETGEYWSPAPAPACGTGDYATRHGFGYSIFEHIQNGIRSELWVYVDLHHPVKYCVLKIRNLTTVPRRLSATGYIEWVLGDTRAKSGPHIVSEMDSNSGALLARNAFHPEFPGRVAFFDVDDPRRTVTCDRSEFIGRNGDLARPRALGRAHLSGRVGAALDPCAAIQVPFELGEGRTREIIFRIGASRNQEDASALVLRCRDPGTARDALVGVGEHWQRMLGVVRLTTPDPGMNLLANGWLVYQVIASRIWGRSGYYQSGGAWGFRDQLQDTMALVHCAPQMLRAQLLLSASRQFLQGDVQHWWHPPTGRGVRTRCSDDYLWLPHAACRYVETTGDSAILREQVAFLDGRELGPHEESYYDLPARANAQATLYEHCRRAIRHGLRFGPHGLPLIGSGDWNDGMNNVGIEGRGESVWLAFFLYDVLTRFAALATGQDDAEFAAQCGAQARELQAHIEAHAWDGEWYLRAWFDDGTPLGSAANQECRIDSIAQSWAELSGCAEDARRVRALESLSTHLVRRDEGLIQLLAPPFDHSELDPGYIKGYVPGVRENGGQYTHAAVWAATAFAERGDAARAYELFGLINPLNHADSAAKAAVYKVEPYVLAADVYGVDPHVGRGGWTWYTGSAGWLYRLIVESIVGVRLERGCLTFKPCAPDSWRSYEVVYCFGSTRYDIEFRREGGEAIRVSLDGHEVAGAAIELTDDGGSHRVQVRIAGGSVALPSGES